MTSKSNLEKLSKSPLIEMLLKQSPKQSERPKAGGFKHVKPLKDKHIYNSNMRIASRNGKHRKAVVKKATKSSKAPRTLPKGLIGRVFTLDILDSEICGII